MKKPIRIALIATSIIVALLVLAVALVPLLFKDRIVALVRTELNERLEATVDFEDVDLSLLSTFPALTVEVESLSITGKGEFDGVELLGASSIGAGIDLMALAFDDRIQIVSVKVDEPTVHVIVNDAGKANYDIVVQSDEPPETEQPSDEGLAFEIEHYEIDDADVHYEEPGVDVLVEGLEHQGRLRVTGPNQELESKTTIESLSVRLGAIRYIKEARASMDVNALLQSEASKLTVESLQVALNQLALGGSGSLGWGGEGTQIDLELASKEGLPVKALVSAIPNAYAADFEGLKTTGRFSFRAEAHGQLGPEDDDIPAFDVAARVRDGTLKYPDLPLAITELELDAKVAHPGGLLDKMKVSVPQYAIAAGQSRAAGELRITQPLSGPNLDLTVDGKVDLAEVAKAYPIPDVEGLAGLVEAKINLSAKGQNVSKLEGAISVRDLEYEPVGGPTIRVSEGSVQLNPKNTILQKLEAEVGSSDIRLKGTAAPLTTFLMGEDKITASVALSSNRLRVEDFLGEAPEEDDETPSALVLPEDLDARLDLDVKNLTYGDLELRNFKGTGRIRNRKLILDGVRADALGGSMKLDGTLTTSPTEPAVFDMTYTVDKVSFAKAFEALPSMRAYAPIARFLDGRFSTDLRASGTLGDDLSPKLDSVDASGLVAAVQTKLSSEFKPLQELSSVIPAIPKPLDIRSFRTRFAIEDGAVEVKPFEVDAKGIEMVVSGKHGLDQEMKYRMSTEVPIAGLSSKLASEVKKLGIDLTKVDAVGVQANLTGSITAPRVSVDVKTDALRNAVADALSAELQEQRERAMKEAQQQADRLIAEAQKQADRIRKEAKEAAERVRKEGYARADQLEREAKGNPLKEIAAREAAKQLRRETDKRVNQAIAEANKRAEQAVAEAKKRADDLVDEAAAQADQASEGIERKTTDRIR